MRLCLRRYPLRLRVRSAFCVSICTYVLAKQRKSRRNKKQKTNLLRLLAGALVFFFCASPAL
jgi:hypothetical protein